MKKLIQLTINYNGDGPDETMIITENSEAHSLTNDYAKSNDYGVTEKPFANARLIAAAPELHAQAKLLERVLVLTEMEGGTDVRDELEKLREILAKVDGGEG